MGRHHIVRQLLAQHCFECFAQRVVVRLLGHQISEQLVVRRHHHSFANAGLGQQQGFDFSQLDTETADLHLMIDPPDVFDHTVGTVARQVAGAV